MQNYIQTFNLNYYYHLNIFNFYINFNVLLSLWKFGQGRKANNSKFWANTKVGWYYDKSLRFLPHRFSMIQTSIEEGKQKVFHKQARTDFLQIVAAMGQSLNRCRRFICWKFVGIAPWESFHSLSKAFGGSLNLHTTWG